MLQAKKFADLQKQLDESEDYINVLERAKETGTTPNFLMLKVPELLSGLPGSRLSLG